MPLALSAPSCRDKCDQSQACKAFVSVPAGCEDHPTDACYLKASSSAPTKQEACTCYGAKPFPAPSSFNTITAAYTPNTLYDPQTASDPWHATEHAVLGPTALEKYAYADQLGGTQFNLGERKAFVR